MDLLGISLISSVTLCSLVSGFIFTYSIVVMPGLSNLNDKDFLKAFQVTDAVIQNNQPLFMFTWIGSILAVLATAVIHIPLNNHIQKIKIEDLNDKALADERINFEKKWNFFNNIRTFIAISVRLLLLVQLSLR